MKREYQEHIVSTDENVRLLHRCSQRIADISCKSGLRVSSLGLVGTSSLQPQDLDSAETIFRNGKGYGDSAVVLNFPRELYEQTRPMTVGEGLKRELAYFHPVEGCYTVKPEFVEGWINRETEEYHPNPYLDRKPIEGHEEFDFMFD